LPALSGTDISEAYSINNKGLIVGDARHGTSYSACIWRNGGVEDLNKLIQSNAGWKLVQATHITDNGLIVGCGIHSKYPRDGLHAFLLTPVSRDTH